MKEETPPEYCLAHSRVYMWMPFLFSMVNGFTLRAGCFFPPQTIPDEQSRFCIRIHSRRSLQRNSEGVATGHVTVGICRPSLSFGYLKNQTCWRHKDGIWLKLTCGWGAELNPDCPCRRVFLHEDRDDAWSVHLYVPNANAIPRTYYIYSRKHLRNEYKW